MNAGFNFYETMSDIREQIFLGDNSENLFKFIYN